jgi:hypothetical protein
MINLFRKWRLNNLILKSQAIAKTRADLEPEEQNNAPELKLQIKIRKYLKKLKGKVELSEIKYNESLRLSFMLGDNKALIELADIYFKEGLFWQKLNKTGYKCKYYDAKMKDSFNTALEYIKIGKEKDLFMAFRLYGKALIYGWGVDIDENKGFKEVITSINKEGNWDNASQIFQNLGVNKPEVFNKILELQGSNTK